MKPLFVPILDNGQGDVKADFLECFIRAFADQKIHMVRVSDSDPRRARNRAAASFLESDCDRMLFIDSDIGFTAADIKLIAESNEPVVGGIYPIKCMELKPCFSTLPGQKPVPVGGLVPVAWCGTGFLSIKRDVLEALKTPDNLYTTHGRKEWDFFRSGVYDNQYFSEDLGFCHAARAAGFSVMVDTRIQLLHEGAIKYPIQRKPDYLEVVPYSMRCDVEAIWDGEYLIELPEHPKTVLDIGGNVGGFTVWAKEQWPEASVYAFEPHPDNAKLFRYNTRALSGVTLAEAALISSDDPTVTLIEGEYPGRHSTTIDQGGSKLSVTALNVAIIPSAEFVKIDTEGAELTILSGLDLSDTKAVAIEYHSDADATALKSLLVARGFRELQHRVIEKNRGILKFVKVIVP